MVMMMMMMVCRSTFRVRIFHPRRVCASLIRNLHIHSVLQRVYGCIGNRLWKAEADLMSNVKYC